MPTRVRWWLIVWGRGPCVYDVLRCYMPINIQWVALVSDNVWGCEPCDCGMLIYYVQCAMRVVFSAKCSAVYRLENNN